MATHPRSLILQFLKSSSSCRSFSSFSNTPQCGTKFLSSLPCRPLTNKAPSLLQHARLSQASRETPRFFTSFAFSPTHSVKSRPGWYRDRESSSHTSRRPGTVHGHPGYGRHGTGSGSTNSIGVFAGFRRWFNKFPGELIVWGIIGINGAIYFAWQYANDRAVSDLILVVKDVMCLRK